MITTKEGEFTTNCSVVQWRSRWATGLEVMGSSLGVFGNWRGYLGTKGGGLGLS